ncbi:restriction endonuclease subunit S [Klebsiella quasipneumoniae]|uniref:restriction endonuclease subunit S n=1 Tax=Klebsiella quasipneumoniae TaxID=1463165 RepID=UPI003EC63AD1
MGSKWEYISLGELITLQRGHDLPSQHRIDGPVPIMGSSGITGFHNTAKAIGPGVIVGRSGDSMGVVSFIDKDYWPLNTCLYITDFKGNDAVYIYYLLKLVNFDIFNSGSAQKSLNRNAVYPHKVLATKDRELQQKIGGILSSFEARISNSNKINQTLEQMSQTLFKSWFVDFDPVIDNALDAGNPIPEALQTRAELRQKVRNSADFKPLPADIRALFPAEFEETELGWVPKGWILSDLGKEFNITMGQSPSGSTYNEDGIGLPFFQGKTDFGFRFPSKRIYCTEPKRLAKRFDTLLSVRAPVGVVNQASTECIIGRGLAALRHKSGNIAFTYYSVSNLSDYFSIFNGEGTVFGSINQKDLKQLPQICPPEKLINKFEEFSGKWETMISVHCNEIESLSNLRDTLLPKLISGELSLEDLPDLVTQTEPA